MFSAVVPATGPKMGLCDAATSVSSKLKQNRPTSPTAFKENRFPPVLSEAPAESAGGPRPCGAISAKVLGDPGSALPLGGHLHRHRRCVLGGPHGATRAPGTTGVLPAPAPPRRGHTATKQRSHVRRVASLSPTDATVPPPRQSECPCRLLAGGPARLTNHPCFCPETHAGAQPARGGRPSCRSPPSGLPLKLCPPPGAVSAPHCYTGVRGESSWKW